MEELIIIIATSIIYIFSLTVNILFFVFFIKIIINAFRRSASHNYFKNNIVKNSETELYNDETSKHKQNIYVDVSKKELERYNTDDINNLKDYLYNIFYKFENAYNNLDFNIMKMLSTKELYQNYHTGIDLDLKIGKKKIIENIERKKMIIYELDSTIAKQTVSAMIEINYVTYTIDRTGNVISGNREKRITERFEVNFRKEFDRRNIVKCPNCGATLTGNICPYCRSTIKDVEFKISSIKRIID